MTNPTVDPFTCTHQGIGLPGCATCDPDRGRVVEAFRRRVAELEHRLAEPGCGEACPTAVRLTAELADAHKRLMRFAEAVTELNVVLDGLAEQLGVGDDIKEPYVLADAIEHLKATAARQRETIRNREQELLEACAEADEHRAAADELRAAAEKALAIHEDVACSCAGCAALRAALKGAVKP